MTAFRLALANLLNDRLRTAVSVVGAGFAVLLIFMQLGFLGAVETTATLLYDRLDFDLLLASSEYLDLTRAGTVPRGRLAEARAVPGVADAVPLSVDAGLWRNPTADPGRGGKRWQITILGVDPGRLDRTFRPAGVGVFRDATERAAYRPALDRLGVVLMDRRSRKEFGRAYDPDAPDIPGVLMPGAETELNGQRVELGGYFEVGAGFSFAGLLMANEETFDDLMRMPPDRVSFGLLTLAPGADPAATARRVQAALPTDVRAFTRAEIADQERAFWVQKTSVGQFFLAGVFLALFVGAIFVYQMMVADIKKHLPEYATLKAMGYRFGYLFRVVVWQAVALAVGGYVFGLLGALMLYEGVRRQAEFAIAMDLHRMLTVFALALGMCVGSGLVAVRKVRTADPADLF